MAIVIGCSGSTGSSLLKTILNRHSQIFAGPETALFAFPQVYNHWGNCKKKLIIDLKNDAWQTRKGANLLQPEFGWELPALQKAIVEADSFQTFVPTFFAKPLQKNKKTVWIEKTPANASGLIDFLQYFPQGKVIQTIRNPYDTIASLMARGINVYAATAYYVYNTAIATSAKNDTRYYQIKYEDLVLEPTETLLKLFDFLDLPFEQEILIAQHENRAEPVAMKGWKHEETASVKNSSINRFKELSPKKQALICEAFEGFRISPYYQEKYQIKYTSGQELCSVLDYEYLPIKGRQHRFLLKLYYWKDRLSRLKHGFWQQFFNYVGTV